MPNHVHPIVVPSDADGLRATFANAAGISYRPNINPTLLSCTL